MCYCNKIGILRKCLYYAWQHEDSTILTYHLDVERMVSEKIKIISEKIAMTERIKKYVGRDIGACFGGEVILSSIQLAWLISAKKTKIKDKMNVFNKYQKNKSVETIWKQLSLCDLLSCMSIKTIPVLMIKAKLTHILMLLMSIMHKLNININV